MTDRLADREWIYYLDTRTPNVLFRQHILLTQQWDRVTLHWIEIDHQYLPDRLRGGNVDLDEISAERAEEFMRGTASSGGR
jgi:hypothetical protein